MMGQHGKLVWASVILFLLGSSAFAGRDDDFGFDPAPLAASIEGVWITENEDLERPVVFKFCQLKSGRVQVSRADSILPGSPLQYTYTMHAGPEYYSVNRIVCDNQFGGYAKLKVSTYFREGRSGEVVLGMTVLPRKLNDEEIIAKSVMKKIDWVGRPKHCVDFDAVNEMISINHQGAQCGEGSFGESLSE